ncbi:hypothetical protein [Micromonospora sp. NBS 11-29]|uniref:hypothetical protein n=1 Tax=Micromonospora sp. NBS 11-29 TaxID=1960879 RepID=UPI000B78E736|nr:hypothetical protein [Micromonospora sp. NBS 11-29]
MRRAAVVFVPLLAVLVVLLVGLAHGPADRVGFGPTAAGSHLEERSEPTPRLLVHVAHAGHTALPHRTPVRPQRSAETPTTTTVADRRDGGPEHTVLRRPGRGGTPPAPDLAALRVYRC